ncbi:type I restriction-modification system methyltransferase subunit, partial [Acidovorax temperans]
MIYSNSAKFPLGQIVATPGALELLQETSFSAAALVSRHVHGDWGD